MHQEAMKTMLFPGKYIQGNGAFEQLPAQLSEYGDRSFSLTTKSMMDMTSGIMAGHGMVEQFHGECCEKEIARVMDSARSYHATAIAAIGGGKVIDCGKIVADRLNLPVVIVPTIASADAPCSGCGVVYSESGTFEYVYYTKRNPDAVLVDTGIIARAPIRFLVSGMGDGLATFFEANACQRSGSVNECGGLRTKTALSIARLCMDTILQNGRQAISDCQKGVVSEAVESIIEANILLSGIGFESCGIASAHSIHNGLTVLSGTHAMYHGEKVAFGIISGLQLYDEFKLIDEIYDFFIDVGLPVCFEDLGVGDITEEQMMAVAGNCCEEGNSMYKEPYTFNQLTVAKAMQKADAMGREKKALKAKQ